MRSRTQATETALIPAVGYIRMSTDDQKDSPERQRGEIVALAERGGYQIIRWYEDHGLTGTESKNRPGFLKLMADLPKREFKTVLMYEQSRFSREDVFDAMAHWKLLKEAGVNIVTVQRGEMRFDDLAGLITAMVGQHEARSESQRLAERSISGRKAKAKQGEHSGAVAFGFDREVFDESGTFVKRVTCFERFRRPKLWTTKLVPSADPQVIDAVRYIFDAIQKGTPMNGIVRELNRRKLTSSRGNAFTTQTVRRMIANPVYVGFLRFGHRKHGKFATAGEEIMIPNAHNGIIGASEFERVNAILRTSYRTPGDQEEPGRYILSRLAVCGHCGHRLVGARSTSEGRVHPRYVCPVRSPGSEECPRHPSIAAGAIEGLVLRLVAKHVLCEENREAFIEALRNRVLNDDTPNSEQDQLMEIRHKIERAEDNMAECDGVDLAAIRKRLAQFRDQERKLIDRMRQASAKKVAVQALPFASSEELALLRNNLHLADKQLVKVALSQTIERVVVVDAWSGCVEFFPEVCSIGPIEFTDQDLRPDQKYIKVAEYVTKTGRPVLSKELGAALNVKPQLAAYHADRAVKFGLLTADLNGQVRSYSAKTA